jgi:hypothetical protein
MQAQRPDEKANGQRWRQRQQHLLVGMRMMTCGSLENHSSISSNESVAAAQSVSITSTPSPPELASVSMSSVSQQHSVIRSAPQSEMQQSEPARAQQVPAAECNANKSIGRTNGLLNLFHDQDTCEFKNHHLDSRSLLKSISLTFFFFQSFHYSRRRNRSLPNSPKATAASTCSKGADSKGPRTCRSQASGNTGG